MLAHPFHLGIPGIDIVWRTEQILGVFGGNAQTLVDRFDFQSAVEDSTDLLEIRGFRLKLPFRIIKPSVEIVVQKAEV